MNLPEAIRTDSFAKQVYNAIRRGIRDGTIARGRFFSEIEFGNSMGVSRTPVREALLVLYREGLVEIVNKRGFRLVELSKDNMFELDEAFHLRLADVAGLRETGRVLMSVRGKMYLIPAGAPIPMMRTEAVIREHAEIVDAVERRDTALAEQLIRDHINRSLDAFIAARMVVLR
jgi:DNA-binding GntR family transcriptional regulator